MPRSQKPPVPDTPRENFEINILRGLIKFSCDRVTVPAIVALVVILAAVLLLVKL
jgi:hypothetical protein